MRSLIISTVLFILVVLCIILNVGYIHNTADSIEGMAAQLSMPTKEKLLELETFWDKNVGLLGLSISTNNLENVDKIIVSLRSAYISGDLAEFEKQRALLLRSADGIRALERLSVENIF